MFLNPNLGGGGGGGGGSGGGGGNFIAPYPCCFLPNNSKTVKTVTFQLCSIK